MGLYPNRASAATTDLLPEILELAQVSSTVPARQTVVMPDSQGPDVQQLQTQLKKLGYYSDVVDGDYRENTKIAVIKFQKAQGLKRVDAIADITTRQSVQSALAVKNQFITSEIVATPKPTAKPESGKRSMVRWSLFGIGVLGSIGALLYLLRWFRQFKLVQNSQISDAETLSQENKDSVTPPLSELETTSEAITNPQTLTSQLLPTEKTSRLIKVTIFDELIKDLRSSDPTKRRKAIWELSQQADSRAIQPLVDLMIDADSQETSLILAALAEISTRTLKPINRALAISMQNESPQVRQNAIRDLTRIYDMMGQMSQILRYALEDPDAEVQATARYALTKMNRMRGLPEQQVLPEDSQNDSKQ